MRKLLILQFRTDVSLDHERELFSKVFDKNFEITFFNVFGSEEFLSDKEFDALIVCGSGQFYLTDLSTDNKKKLKNIEDLILDFIKKDKPTLGICFGHQIISSLLGGKVESDLSQAEAGTIEIIQNDNGKRSKLFKNLPEKFFAAQGHKESVVLPPKNAVNLASSKIAKYQSFQIGKNVFTVQFHPEFELNDLLFRFSLYPGYQESASNGNEFNDISDSTKLLVNFKNLVEVV